MIRPRNIVASAAVALALRSGPAEAHIVASRLGDFYTGALHPLTDPQDVVTWFGLAVLAGWLGAKRGRWLIVVFPFGLLLGLLLGVWTGFTSAGRLADAAFIVVLGALIAAAVRLPGWALWCLAGTLAVLRGAVNAGGIGPETNATLFADGVVVCGYGVMTLVMALTLALLGGSESMPRDWRHIAVRACGSWIAAIGIMMGGYALVS